MERIDFFIFQFRDAIIGPEDAKELMLLGSLQQVSKSYLTTDIYN